uniref:TBC1 domain family member 10A n=1 Tax=Cacopsylla melanoneura TaxID=428564 RepID=A0A8D8WAR9_9HEMI
MTLVRKTMRVVKARDPSSVLALETMRARKYLPYRTSMGFWAVNNTRHIQSKYHQQYKAYPDNKKLDPRSISQLLNREKKWMEMIRQWDLNMQKNYKKVRSRCRKGIPRKIRPLAWHYLCGGQLLMGKPDTGCYAEFLSREGDPKYLADIQKDIDRQFFHEMFLSRETSSTTGGEEDKPPPGKQALVNILKAYSVVNPVVGYCQAQAPIAAFLLMHMPEEHAFWCLFSICDKYLRGYYSPGMEMIQLDGDILFNLLKKVSPHIHKLLTKQQVDPIMYMTEWFLCAFVRTLPWETLLRVWDMFLCEGKCAGCPGKPFYECGTCSCVKV